MTVLPAFVFNPKRDWWEAPLEQLQTVAEALAPCSLSQGAQEWLAQKKRDEALPIQYNRGCAKLFK